MRYLCLLALLSAGLLLASAGSVAVAEEDSAAFFNGKNTGGWEGLPEYWLVKDGAIVGKTPKEGLKFNTFLCSKAKYGDFELKFQVKLTGDLTKANSGVQIRSAIKDRDKFVVFGPQCDIGQQFWATLYGEHFVGGKWADKGALMKAGNPDVVKKVLKPGEFNDYYIKAVGKHVTIKLNGETTVDGDFADMPATGIIAWQLHQGPQMEVVFKNIQFKDLGKK